MRLIPKLSPRGALRSVAVAAVAIAVHWRIFKYPLIQDDWIRVEWVSVPDPIRMLLAEFSPYDKGEYRPLGAIYFWIVTNVFNLNPILTHAVTLTLHCSTSLLVALVLTRITRDALVGWTSGALYAAAVLIHMDPLLWASGIFDSASGLLALLALWLFLSDRIRWSAVAYAVALLFKESVLFLPLVLWTTAWTRHQRSPSFRSRAFIALGDVWIFVVVSVVHAGIKLAGVSPLGLPDDHPYALRFAGPHVLGNTLTYSKWAVSALWPTHPASPRAAAIVLIGAWVALGLLLLQRRTRSEFDGAASGAPVLAVWLVSAVALFVFLPNHVYRYYLGIAFPALLGLLTLTARIGCARAGLPLSVVRTSFVVLAVASAVSSFSYFRRIDQHGLDQAQRDVEGTNDLVRRGVTVMLVRDSLMKAHAVLQPNAILLFKGVELWAFGKNAGPRIWYGDPTIRAYDARNLAWESNALVLRNPAEGQSELYTGATRRILLDCCPIYFFELTGRELVERPLLAATSNIERLSTR